MEGSGSRGPAAESHPQPAAGRAGCGRCGRSSAGRSPGPSTPHPVHGSDVFPQQMGSDFTVTPGFDTSKQMTAPLLVRLPADLHDRLRRWSTTNGFSMAAVARGLIERFLNEQERTAR